MTARRSTAPPDAPPGAVNALTVSIPMSITFKDVVVIVTALITIISSWTFYTMRLSVQEIKLLEYKTQIEKVNLDLEAIHKDIQDLRMKSQAIEIRQALGKP